MVEALICTGIYVYVEEHQGRDINEAQRNCLVRLIKGVTFKLSLS